MIRHLNTITTIIICNKNDKENKKDNNFRKTIIDCYSILLDYLSNFCVSVIN